MKITFTISKGHDRYVYTLKLTPCCRGSIRIALLKSPKRYVSHDLMRVASSQTQLDHNTSFTSKQLSLDIRRFEVWKIMLTR